MEFRDTGCCKDDKVWAGGEEYPDSITGRVDDEEEELSFCDLVTERADLKSYGESSVQKEDFGFDLDLGACNSMAFVISPADDLFHKGRLLPLNFIRHEKSRLLNEKVQAWRRDSTNFIGFNSRQSQDLRRPSVYSDKILRQGNSTSKPPNSDSKICFKWQQIFSMGLVKAPPIKVEEMRPKQGKPKNDGLEYTFLKRRALSFQQKSVSVRDNLSVKKARTHSSWWMLGPLKSFNSCKFSSNSVMDCLSGVGKSPSKMLSIEADQNSLSLAQDSVK
ncbi:hypothetical protein SUGI_0905060 [Cryptomeria japonica]|uniref:uncharacterized protein LOC131038417 n=1 Tax=Cryptomeria japonica TaxID=3369 RepID=UPI002414A1D7|nr:uncharacterized protein LOC131038417 [Cryptomeria japonica]GLJ43526.1 hypothetical protein SUGI_0905060 [Cryptomeria japonica]